MKNLLPVACCLLIAAIGAAGCAKARAQTVPDGPPLATPPPPSRVFAPIEQEEPIASAQVPDAPKATTPAGANTTAKSPPPRPRQAETERAEQPAASAPQPAPTIEAPRELRAASSPSDAESEREINDLVRRANQTLSNVYYQGLTSARKEQYDQVKQLVKETDQAMKVRDFPYAKTLADKAFKLATELTPR